MKFLGVYLKNAIRPLLAIAVFVPAQMTTGGSLGFNLFGTNRSAFSMSEPATLVFLGFAMLMFAKGARRREPLEASRK